MTIVERLEGGARLVLDGGTGSPTTVSARC